MPDHDVLARDALVADAFRVMRVLGHRRLSSVQEELVRTALRSFLPGPRQGDLFEPVPTREGSHRAGRMEAMMSGEVAWHDPVVGLAVKVASTIGHLRAGRWDRVSGGEGATVAAVLGLEIPGRTADGGGEEVDAETPASDEPVEFLFPWRSGGVRTRGRLRTATAHVSLLRVAAVDAPVACSLWTPEGRIEIRRLGSEWLRPVLSPGSWRPLTETMFRDAARGGVAWRDSPFLGGHGGCAPIFHVLDYAEAGPPSEVDDRRMVEARNACLVRAGQFHVIDGIVHRSTSAPTAGFATSYEEGVATTGPVWRMGGLGSTQDTGSFGRSCVGTWFNGMVMPGRSGEPDPDQGLVALPDWIGVVRHMTSEMPSRPTSRRSSMPTVTDLVWPSASLQIMPDTTSVLGIAADLAMRLLPLTDMLDQLARRADPCTRLKQALADLRAEVGGGRTADQLGAIRTICEDVTASVGPRADPRAGMWTYVASLASYAAGHGLGSGIEDEGLAALRL